MKHIQIFSVLFLTFLTSTSYSQEVGLGIGLSEYGGDLAKTPFILNETKPGVMAYGKYPLSDKISLKGMLGVQKISGSDLNKKTSIERGLEFENTILDLNALVHYSFTSEDYNDITPYIYAGLGVFKHNPKAEIDEQKIELQPLGTEGQGIAGYADKYKLVDFSIPMGIGAKFNVQDEISAFFDIKSSKTFTDHLDDVGARKFANPTELLANNGELAYKAAYRGNSEKGWPADYAAFNDDTIRNSYLRTTSNEKKDWYYLITVGASYSFGIKNKNSRIGKNKVKVPYKR